MIEVNDIRKTYGKVPALDGVSFSIARGEVFGLLGPNGAGKSTLIRMLTCLTRPDGGSASIGGHDVVTNAAAIKSLVGVVPQENNLDRDLSVEENLHIYGMLHRVKNLSHRIDEVLAEVELSDRRDSVVTSLSGGMKRRLIIARSLLSDPAALFFDEPSIGLDPQIRRQLWEIVRRTARSGRTVLLTTHYIEEADALCDRIGILAKGKLIALGSPAALREMVGPYVVDRIDDNGRLLQHISGTREKAHEIARNLENGCTVRKTNLEDVFVKLTGERIE
ncbi:MAG: ABC transporter ATP-binding protein [Desulfuromonadales bacterium]|nr:ABC transporter ATP-binding protein [Desulfuromonadales bacterium]